MKIFISANTQKFCIFLTNGSNATQWHLTNLDKFCSLKHSQHRRTRSGWRGCALARQRVSHVHTSHPILHTSATVCYHLIFSANLHLWFSACFENFETCFALCIEYNPKCVWNQRKYLPPKYLKAELSHGAETYECTNTCWTRNPPWQRNPLVVPAHDPVR